MKRLITRGGAVLAILGMVGLIGSSRAYAGQQKAGITGFLTCDLCGINLFAPPSPLDFIVGLGDEAVVRHDAVEFEVYVVAVGNLIPIATANFTNKGLSLHIDITSDIVDSILSLLPPDFPPPGPIPVQIMWVFSGLDRADLGGKIKQVRPVRDGDFEQANGALEFTENDILISHRLLLDGAASFHQDFQIDTAPPKKK
jgi:hypothetical protein